MVEDPGGPERARFELMADVSRVGMWKLDMGTMTFEGDPRWAQMLGFPEAPYVVPLAKLGELPHPDDFEHANTVMTDHLEGRTDHFEFEYRLRTQAGGYRWVRVRGCVTERTSTGAPRLIEGVNLDIDAERRHADELRNLEAQLQEAHRQSTVGQLASGIAHDLNNMLTVLVGLAELAQDAFRSGEDPAEDLEALGDAAQRAASSTSGLLALSRRRALQVVPSQVDRVIAQLRRTFEHTLPAALRLVFEPGAEDARTLVDPITIEQVLMNLCINARDAMRDGGVLKISTDEVELEAAEAATRPGLRPGAYVRVTVEDQGEGMSPEVLSRAFEPFYTTKPSGHGTGLGLPNVRRMLEQYEGHIDARSTLGVGTTFEVFLPKTSKTTEVSVETTSLSTRLSATVLVADADRMVLTYLQRVLQRAGCEVLAAEDGASALEQLQAHGDRVELALLDHRLSVLPPEELVTRLGDGFDPRRVVVMGELLDQEAAGDGPELVVLAKPFSPQQLVLRISEIIQTLDTKTA